MDIDHEGHESDHAEALARAERAGRAVGVELLDEARVEEREVDVGAIASRLRVRWTSDSHRPEWARVFLELSRREARDAWTRGLWDVIATRE